jgi:hypothetical protein
MQLHEGFAAAIEQRKLSAQSVHQPEQATAQPVSAIVVTPHPAASLQFGQHQRTRRRRDAAFPGQLGGGVAVGRIGKCLHDIHRAAGRG